MQGLLGKITLVEKTESSDEYRVTFKPEAVLPSRSAAPEWLKDQSLTLTRRVVDAREAGQAGDGIVIPAAEAAKWLAPLTVSPETVYAAAPGSISVRLAWWKEEKAPDVTVRAGGRTLKSTLTPSADGVFTADIDLTGLGPVRPPSTIEVECGGTKAVCSVLAEEGAAVKSIVGGRPHLTVVNDWYRVDLATSSNAGGISTLRERGRGLNHFAPPENLIQPPLEFGGQYEHFKYGFEWHDIAGVGVDVVGSRREGDAVRVTLESAVDEGHNLHSTAHYTIFDNLPLVVTQREFRRHKPKEEKPDEPKEPIDGIDSFAYSCRSAVVAEHGDVDGSRVFVSEEGKLYGVRLVRFHETENLGDLNLTDGWVLAEHPGRRSYMLYLTDRTDPPSFLVWRGFYEMAVEPLWSFGVLGPGQSAGLSMALAAGETGGADARGAWVACRSAVKDGTQRCAVVARLTTDKPSTAVIRLGDRRRETALEKMHLPGVGSVQIAIVDIEGANAGDAFAVEVGGIRGR